ncbi:HEPN domain-containing protein [Amycolatopsis thailandensis]|uniref:HEPN domain-containing protein n=1 Tax=Amycolatopsis thailandensis TaxID=589330 RepID=UPI00362DBBD0
MTYRSPFGEIGTAEHNDEDALCLSRTHCADAVEDTLAEFHQAAVATIDSGAAQPAFFLARQLAELGLKALHAPDFPRGHNLATLLESLRQRDDELLDGGTEQNLVVAFVRDLHEYDPIGDEGRYPTTLSGEPALATVCCADPTGLREHVDRLHGYIRRRLATLASSPV